MKAWLLDDFTGTDALRLADVPDPVLQPGEALLEVRYAALNPADRYLAERQYPAKPPLPHILGRDALGTVLSVKGGAGLRVGDKRLLLRGAVGVTRPGSFAQRVAAPVENLAAVPEAWSDAEAAGASLVYLTAYQALTMWGPLPSGAVVLVSGASGGVGIAALQLATAMDYVVVGLSRSREKARCLESLGAAAVFDPHDPEWRLQLKNKLAPRRVDLAIDNVGGSLLPEVIDTVSDLGKVSLVGRLAGPVPNFNTGALFFRRLRMGGVAVGAYTNEESRAAWEQVVLLLARTGARPQVDSIFAFSQLPQAFRRLAQGPFGKVLLRVSEQ